MSAIILLLVFLAVIGLVAYFLTSLIPMPPPISKIIWIVASVACVLVVLNAFGLLDGNMLMTMPRLKH